ncbi:MAG: hypothetical protein JWO53_899, partial [Chlamydiia bacterium]|nr:hypothetical protein [Chlamydiia bacterium]
PPLGEATATLLHHCQNCSIGGASKNSSFDARTGIAVTITGKLYHKEALKKAILERHGTFSESDTSLIIAGFDALGTALFPLLKGQFAVIILDQKKKELYVIRSRTGGEEIYWSASSHAVLISSTLKALLSTGQIASAPDLHSLANYLFFGYISQDKTPIQGVNKLLPGYFLKLSFDGKMAVQSFASFSSSFFKNKERHFEASEDLFKEITTRISEAVSLRCNEEEGCPAVMNGSTGSKALQEIFLHATERPPVPSLNIQFDSLSPLNIALEDHAMVNITPEMFLKDLIPMIWTTEMPLGDPLEIATWHFASLCRNHNLIPFFDTGFDAEFYNYSTPLIQQDILTKLHPTRLTKLKSLFYDHFYDLLATLAPKLAFSFLRKAQKRDPRLQYIESKGLLSQDELLKASPELGKLFHPDMFLHQFYHLPKIRSEPASLFYLTMKTEVIDKIHTSRSKIARHFGIASQSPFIDTELLSFFASLSEAVWASPDVLPSYPEYLLKTKIAPPKPPRFDAWLKHPQIRALFQSLTGGLLVESGFISNAFLKTLLQRQDTRTFFILYNILVLEIWMKLFIDRPLSQQNKEISIQELLGISKEIY